LRSDITARNAQVVENNGESAVLQRCDRGVLLRTGRCGVHEELGTEFGAIGIEYLSPDVCVSRATVEPDRYKPSIRQPDHG
jgi:hypothetical protein